MFEPWHWRERAKRMMRLAMDAEPVSREMMLKMAAGYELLAQRAEQRLLAAQGGYQGLSQWRPHERPASADARRRTGP